MLLKMLKDIPEKSNGGLYKKDHIYDFPEEQGLSWLKAKDENDNPIKIVEEIITDEPIEVTPMPYLEKNNNNE